MLSWISIVLALSLLVVALTMGRRRSPGPCRRCGGRVLALIGDHWECARCYFSGFEDDR